MTNKIHKLPPHLIAQIAAGEVIERPSYAVKELIDNAIDAGATEITVTLEEYGLKRITITDNGSGMSKEDLFESYKIHTTSKVEDEDSLTAVKSMGFRGEALASIAAVSDLIIKTKTADELAGNFLELHQGKEVNSGPTGMAKGTIIEVKNIFANIPARKKFLRSPQTELRQIIDVFTGFALMLPEIKFSLVHNGKNLFNLLPNDNLGRIKQIVNTNIFQNLISIENKNGIVKVSGFISKPQITTQSSTKQFLFINGRRINDKIIAQAVKESFSQLIPEKQLPVFYIYLTIPHEYVDVNVHPRKEQVAFFNTQMVYDSVLQTVTAALHNNALHYTHKTEAVTKDLTGQLLKQAHPWRVKNEKLHINYQSLIQMHDLYLVVEAKQGILFFDQHAAHERILYEQYKKEFEMQKQKKYEITPPLSLKLSAQDKIIVDEYRKELSENGFMFNQSYDLIKIPLLFKNRNLPDLITELLENIEIGKGVNIVDNISHRIIRFLACKNAVKAGDPLQKNEATKLIKKLEQTENNISCPHGRPTKYLFSFKDLQTLFKRN